MKTRVIAIVMSAIVLVFLAGCSKPPQMEMQNANTALQAAKTAEAEQYAPTAYRAAMDSLNAANAAKQQQDSKFALFRSYGKSREMFVKADVAAKQAEAQAKTEKERVKQEVTQLLAQAQAALDTASAALKKAPRGKGSKVDLAMITNDLTAATAARDDALADFNAGKYLSARSKITAVIQRIQRITQELQAASMKKK